jgi:hypothetical protein
MKLGDAIKSVTEAIGIPQCEPCKERQQKLNELSDYLLSLFGGSDDTVATQRSASSHGDDGDRGTAGEGRGEEPAG